MAISPAQRKAAAMKARRRKKKAVVDDLDTAVVVVRFRKNQGSELAEAFKPSPSRWERFVEWCSFLRLRKKTRTSDSSRAA